MNHWFFLPPAPFCCQLLLFGNRMHPALGLAVLGPLALLGWQGCAEDAFPLPPLLCYQPALLLTRTASNALKHCSPPHPSHSLLSLHQWGSPTCSGKEDMLQREWDTSLAGCTAPAPPPASEQAHNWGSPKLRRGQACKPGARASTKGSGVSAPPRHCPMI